MRKSIENEYLKVEVDLLGGALTSFFDKKKNEELLYQKEEGSWQGQDVVIFPFVARLKNQTYLYKGKEYSMRNHGLCRYNTFTVKEEKEDKLAISFVSSDETLKEYPFPFEVNVTYLLEDKKLKVSFEIINKGKEIMPFGLGSHPAFILDSIINNNEVDTSGNYVYFNEEKELTRICFDEKGEMVLGEEKYQSLDRIEIKKELFKQYKTLCVKGNNLNDVTLVRKNGRKIYFHYDDINYFVLWSFPNNGSFVAIEPWMSLPDFDNAPKEIDKKETLLHLEASQSYLFKFDISID